MEGGEEAEGGGEAVDSLNWERSVGPPDGAAGRLSMSSLQTPLYRKMGGNIRVSHLTFIVFNDSYLSHDKLFYF